MAKTKINEPMDWDNPKKNEIDISEIDAKLEEMDLQGKLPKISVSLIRVTGPSRLNTGEGGEQKTNILGNEPRAFYSSNSKKRVISKNIHPTIVRTTSPAKIIKGRFQMRDAGHPTQFYNFIEEIMNSVFGGEKAGSFLFDKNADIDAVYNIVSVEIGDVDRDGEFKKNSALAKEIAGRVKEKILERKLNLNAVIRGAFFSDFATSDMIITYHGGLHIAHSIGVTPFYDEENLTSAVDDYNYIDDIRALEDRGKRMQGSVGNFSIDLNSGIFLESYKIDMRCVMRTLMQYFGTTVDEAWEESLQIFNEESAKIYYQFLTSMPEGGQHGNMTSCNPSAVLVHFTNGEPTTAEDMYSDAIKTKDAEIEAVRRLMDYAGQKAFEVPDITTKCFATVKDNILRDGKVNIPDNVELKNTKEMIEMIQKGVEL